MKTIWKLFYSTVLLFIVLLAMWSQRTKLKFNQKIVENNEINFLRPARAISSLVQESLFYLSGLGIGESCTAIETKHLMHADYLTSFRNFIYWTFCHWWVNESASQTITFHYFCACCMTECTYILTSFSRLLSSCFRSLLASCRTWISFWSSACRNHP